ncbi:hypothetical protein Aspvir_001639 [Aspergillus viridinutans]|uniref:Uncharacterized protein n=1 Tax=Aspergillus viridinutans TaxID=75553 RepID=A0A9P3BRZ0_ASPVI|nr:uncharacterized protein Aspvir_001639 [Aspergillus viridinutans]GIJ99507.1 hypothetical protein Aspvir_001639 [Aspergillus viridinutans]
MAGSDAAYGFDPFSDEAASDDNTAFRDIDWSNPADFFDSVSPNLPRPTSFPTADEVRQESRKRATKILSDWETLNKIIERHEERIQKRWRQKTKAKRRQILLSAWPNMSKMHRPDFDAFKKGRREESREAYLWPYINLEDLEQTRPLLLLLNARSRHQPYCFAHADYNAPHLGHGTGAIRSAFLNLHTMMFTGRTTPETYGELIAWDDNDDASRWLYHGKGFHPGHGLVLLEIQQRIYEFLLVCTRQILHDIPEAALIKDFPVLPEPAIKDEGDWHSLAAVAADAPYRLPAQLDLASLEDIIDAKRSAAEDHLIALREDPGYFADVVNDYKEHRVEVIPDTNGNPHPTLAPHIHPLFWNRVLQNVVPEAYMNLEIWSTLHSLVADLRQLLSKHNDRISPEKDLPDDVYTAFVDLKYILEQFAIGPINQLKIAAPASHPLRPLFVRQPQQPGTSKMIAETRAGVSRSDNQGELLWILETLWGDSHQVSLAGRKTLMDELERLVQMDPKNKELVSSHVAGIVSDLAVISECLHQIDLYQPWANTFENGFVERQNEIQNEYGNLTSGWNKYLVSFEGTSLAKLGSPEDGRFHYPAEKRRTRENVELMRSAERNLDTFWRAVDSIVPVTRGMTRRNAVYKVLTRVSGSLQRTPAWVEPEKQPAKVKNLEKSLADLQFELVQRTEKTIEPAPAHPPKKKVKSQGKPSVSDKTVERELPAENWYDVQPTFKVDKRSLKVFSTLFFQPSQTAQPGEIPWNDFLHAMDTTAFTVEKLYGSVWQFTPRNLDVERSIQFHEPHPIAKIPFRVARRIGRRLNRAYGWHGQMFTLA